MMLKFNNYVFNTGQIILRIKDNVLPLKKVDIVFDVTT
jgi:hypothetical protein